MNGITVGMRVELISEPLVTYMGKEYAGERGVVRDVGKYYALVSWDNKAIPERPWSLNVLTPLFPEIPVAEVTEDLIWGCGYDPEKIDFQSIADWVRHNEAFRDFLQDTVAAALADIYPSMEPRATSDGEGSVGCHFCGLFSCDSDCVS